ncbi:MAG TPA: uroporphyrinogen decarboxylase family protein [Bryobacteraceae bacterium]|nr:uroporphyrinogen decarboxylase family protein [Bryobacteraceae bacterium]HPT25340.1 uroporphyrinogen decarboxylase family protein [Bryobacteraceae bacterium]
MTRTDNCLKKLDRMNKALRHEEPDRVPVSDFFWGGFLKRWRQELGLSDSADPYRHYDLDWQVTLPNMDPHIRPFETISESLEEVTVRTGFGAIIRKKFDLPMPAFVGFDTDSIERLEALEFDSAWDDRRFFAAGDNQIAGVGDGFQRNTPPWIESVEAIHSDFPVYGSVCEAHEMLWRIVGSENVMYWIGEHPDRLGAQIERVGRFCVDLAKAQIRAAGGLLDGMVVWGDVAYRKCMLFSPAYWRRWFKPVVAELVNVCHDAGLPVIYHGCGNARRIFEDFIECGIDAYNPLEAKAGLDVVELRRELGHRLAFCGNMDVRLWADGSFDEIRTEVLRKLEAARGGGYIFQSDHSVPSDISAERYEFALQLVRRHGQYPLVLSGC